MTIYLNGNTGEFIQRIGYRPQLQDSGDLEAATKSITATAEPGAADYTSALTIAAPSDARLVVSNLGVRLAVTIDSFGGGGTILNYRISRGGTSVATGTVSTGASTGAKVVVGNVSSGTLTGAATYTIFFWVDAGSCVISVVQLYVAVGATGATGGYGTTCLTLSHIGSVQIVGDPSCQGGGTMTLNLQDNSASQGQNIVYQSNQNANPNLREQTRRTWTLASGTLLIRVANATQATDLAYIDDIGLTLRTQI